MKFKTLLALLAATLCFASQAFAAGEWEDDNDTATGTDVPDGTIIGQGGRSILYYYIPATTSASSDTFVVQRGRTATVSLNAHTADTGSNGITIQLMRVISPIDTFDEDNAIVVNGLTLTGAGVASMIWEVPYGTYWVDVITPTAAGNSLVVVEEGVAALR